MARAIWNGAITFGLVTVPVAVHTAVRESRPRFRLLHAADKSPIKYQRVCLRDGEPVEWNDIVKGYEYTKGRFVVLTREDFEAATVGRKGAIGVLDFVPRDQIDDRYFEKPYHLVPTGPGARAYQVLRAAMDKTGLVAIATVVLRQSPHLCCVHPLGDALELSLLRYADEIVETSEVDLPAREKLPAAEVDLAVRLIRELKVEWDPARYTDEYRERLQTAIEERAREGKVHTRPAELEAPSNVIDLMERLQRSLAGAKGRRRPAAAAANRTPRRASGGTSRKTSSTKSAKAKPARRRRSSRSSAA
ncbi:MAG TPA: Ku protein [Vicinamibacterales bacterium]